MTDYTILLDGTEVSEVQDAVFDDSGLAPEFMMLANSIKEPGQTVYQLRRNSDNKTVPIQFMGVRLVDGTLYWTGVVLVRE